MSARPVDEVVDPSFAVPGAPSTALRHAHASSASFAAAEPQVDQYRGYTICGIAQPVQNLMYRAWAEITQDDRRVERSGLIGPRFTDAEEAEQFALDWARQWIDRHGASDEPAREPQGEVLAGLSALARAESDIQRFIAERHAGALSKAATIRCSRSVASTCTASADRRPVKRAGRRVPRRPRGSPVFPCLRCPRRRCRSGASLCTCVTAGRRYRRSGRCRPRRDTHPTAPRSARAASCPGSPGGAIRRAGCTWIRFRTAGTFRRRA